MSHSESQEPSPNLYENGSGYMYNENGSLVADKSRGIAYITYDYNNNPKRIYFTNGSVTKYVYSASGQKLRVVHYTAKPNISRAWGKQPAELIREQILQSDSTDYLLGGSLTVRNGRLDKYLFEGGYAQASAASSTTDNFAFYFYNQDHLGNNREVVDASGNICQVTNYYPFGAPYADSSAVKNADFQQYKYNGKELDRMHGLDTYDYGARQYDPILARWDRMDPLAEKYYAISPYAYCGNNPVKYIDPDGREVIDELPAKTEIHAMGKQNFFNRWHDNENSIILMGHSGDDGGKSFRTGSWPYSIDANSLYSMAYFLEDNTLTWNKKYIMSDNVELVLFSCETGSDDGLAENLSKQDDFQDISIFAPSESVCIHPDGSVSIDNNGVWREYRNGEVINEYSGNTVPGTQEFNSSSYWEKYSQITYWN